MQRKEPVVEKVVKRKVKTAVLDQVLRDHAKLVSEHLRLTEDLKLSEQMVLDMYPLEVGVEYSSGDLRAKKVASYRPAKVREEYEYVKIWSV